jgi:[ribosomal protein S5]-alanine N-acetyltransferase
MRIDCDACVIRPYRFADKADVARQADNPKVWANVRDYFPHPYTEQHAEEWIAHASAATPMTHFAIEADGRFAGGIGLKLQADVDRVSAELGYWLGEAFWSRGIATAAIKGW